jgi:phosphatidylserine decarboxylase
VFTRYGLDVLVTYALIAAIVVTITIVAVHSDVVRISLFVLIGIVTLLVLNFFRDPSRRTPDGERIVVSPCDGRVVLIRQVFEPEFLQRDAVQVSVFMSPLDVHVNRIPISGVVKLVRHVPGEFLAAFDDKSSERNERMHIGIENPETKILFKQIAGAVARRIVAELTPGMSVTIGERFGMIKFGSRVDILMPAGTDVRVGLNDRVIAGETILAMYGAPTANATAETRYHQRSS